MEAALITSLGGPTAVEVTQVTDPIPGPSEVLIRVRTAGVSFPEVLRSRGMYQEKTALPFIPGSEVSGDVISSPESSHLRPGDRVAAFPLIGGFAEMVAAPLDMTFALPETVSYEQGAAFILNYGTANFSLRERGRMQRGDAVLVHGAAGGVGTASLQVARAFGAGRIIAVTSTADKGAIALMMGADEYVLAEDFKDPVNALGGADIIVDPVGGDRFIDSLRCLRPNGRLVVVGFASGTIPTVRVNRLLLNNIDIVGADWGRYLPLYPGHVAKQWDALVNHLRRGALTPLIGPRFRLEEVREALTCIDERRATGKVVLTI